MVARFKGSAAGQTVPHVRFRIVPRDQATALGPHAAVAADSEQLCALAARISAALVHSQARTMGAGAGAAAPADR